jgi:hypothetical protein
MNDVEEPTLEEPMREHSFKSGPTRRQRVLESVPLARENAGHWVRVPGMARYASGWQDTSDRLKAGELTDDPEGAWEVTTRTVDFEDDGVRLIALYIKYVGDEA